MSTLEVADIFRDQGPDGSEGTGDFDNDGVPDYLDNKIARNVVEEQRGKDPEWVFPGPNGGPYHRMSRTAWKNARNRAGLPQVRIHDLKHTFGFRLRSAGVSFEDRQDLLGHKSGRITTHYSAPDIQRLLESANKVCERRESTVLRPVTRTKLAQSVAQKDRSRVDVV